jgi:hypothetical protein
MRIKVTNDIKNIKEFNNAKVLFKLIASHLVHLQLAEFERNQCQKGVSLELYLDANTRIKNHIGKKQQQVKTLMYDHRYEAYAIHIMQCLSKIMSNLNSIEWKMD